MVDDADADMLALDRSRDRLVIVHHIEAVDLVAGEILAGSAAGVSGVRPRSILSLANSTLRSMMLSTLPSAWL
jgi:hypothetical protein